MSKNFSIKVWRRWSFRTIGRGDRTGKGQNHEEITKYHKQQKGYPLLLDQGEFSLAKPVDDSPEPGRPLSAALHNLR